MKVRVKFFFKIKRLKVRDKFIFKKQRLKVRVRIFPPEKSWKVGETSPEIENSECTEQIRGAVCRRHGTHPIGVVVWLRWSTPLLLISVLNPQSPRLCVIHELNDELKHVLSHIRNKS